MQSLWVSGERVGFRDSDLEFTAAEMKLQARQYKVEIAHEAQAFLYKAARLSRESPSQGDVESAGSG